jgi:hypothetical protein
MTITTKQNIIFWSIILVLSIHFKFYETINLPPQSTDLWRQADCYSIALNYYQNGFHFLKPQVHFLFEQNGYAAGEFPLIYFIAAILFKFFGVHYFLFKGINLLIFYTGIFSLYKIALKLTKDSIFATILSILFFCTPVVFFYGNNFLSDVSALCFNIIGTLFLLNFLNSGNKKFITITAICLALGGLLKASAGIYLIAIICALCYELIFAKTKSGYYAVLHKNKYSLLLQLIGSSLCIFAWYLYAIKFNQSNQTVFFGTKAMKGWPLWENNFQEIKNTLHLFKLLHIELLSAINLTFFVISILYLLVYIKMLDAFFLRIWLFLMLGLTFFICYFWKGFIEQQYYLVNLIIFPVITILLAYTVFSERVKISRLKYIFYSLAFVSTLLVIYHSKNMYKCYYKGGWRHQKLDEVYYTNNLESQLNLVGIKKTDKIISLSDGTPNGTLSMLNRRGWSSYTFSKQKGINKDDIELKIKQGAGFIVINDTSLLSNEAIKNYLHHKIGSYKNLYFYKIKQN